MLYILSLIMFMSGFGGGYFYILYKYETMVKNYNTIVNDYTKLQNSYDKLAKDFREVCL